MRRKAFSWESAVTTRQPPACWLTRFAILRLLGLVYVVWMYISDAQAVGWLWATFLGALRFTVYVLVAAVFLLPALQNMEKSESHSRVLLLIDVLGPTGIAPFIYFQF